MHSKLLLNILLALSLTATTATSLFAQSTDEPQNPPSRSENESPAKTMGEVLKDVKPFNGRINKKAQYYIYLQSASWCGPCQREMPEIVKEYRKMKRKGVELILCSFDDSISEAKDFLKSHKAKFPAVTLDDAAKLPGFVIVGAIPAAVFVTAEGENIVIGHGELVKDWKSVIGDWEKNHAPEDETR